MTEKEKNDIMTLFENKSLVKICAPMVRYSKLQFRNLVRKYDCDLLFTPMILADSFCKSDKARNNEFTTNLLDTPLVVQFAANTIHDFAGATYLISPFCDGVDLNCGCPQRWAKEMELGCEMLKHPQVIYDLVRECRNRISKPFTVSVKTRIQKDLQKTVEVCRQLEKCGVSFLSIHARTPDDNVGPINEDALKIVVENIKIPVIGNGGVASLAKGFEIQEKTNVKGIMVANGILTNPTLFSGSSVTSIDCVQDWLDICYNSTLSIDEHEKITEHGQENYCAHIPEKPFNLTFQCFHHHLVFMLEKVLTRRQRQIFNNLKTFRTVLDFLENSFGLRPKLFKRKEFLTSLLLNLDYSERDMVYNALKPLVEDQYEADILVTEYDNASNGKYFKSKVLQETEPQCDWSNMFIEND